MDQISQGGGEIMLCESCKKSDMDDCGFNVQWISPNQYVDDWTGKCDGYEPEGL
jgi:hypothetical protein